MITRYLTRRRDENLPLPDLLVIDGGRGQLNAARDAATKLGFESIPLISLAKREEEVYLPDRPEPLRLPRRSPALRLLQRLRDEAHRFGLAYSREPALGAHHHLGAARHSRASARAGAARCWSVSAASPGCGARPPAELAAVPGVSSGLAERIRAYLEAHP